MLLLVFFGCTKNRNQIMGPELFQIQTKTSVIKFIESNEFITLSFTQDELKQGDVTRFSD